ncbi:MAG: hypothetical protein LAN71_13500 [Acidobacteriia bacterium]|nr:hypothetical protein [Terriglobia bacterium]
MKKNTLILSIALIAAALAVFAGQQAKLAAQTPSRIPVMDAQKSVLRLQAPDNSKPEPPDLYGYVTVLDPSTNTHYFGNPNDPYFANAPGKPSGSMLATVFVIFRGTADPSQRYEVPVTHPMSAYRGNPHNSGDIPTALWYYIHMIMDSHHGSFPSYTPMNNTIYYDSTKWRYLSVELRHFGWQEPAQTFGSTSYSEVVDFRAVPPISGLPEFYGSSSGPR